MVESEEGAVAPPSVRRPGRLADTEHVAIDDAGRLVLPARFRKALGVRGRTELVASLEGDAVRLRTVGAALERLRAIARRRGRDDGGVVDAFIAERRSDAGLE